MKITNTYLSITMLLVACLTLAVCQGWIVLGWLEHDDIYSVDGIYADDAMAWHTSRKGNDVMWMVQLDKSCSSKCDMPSLVRYGISNVNEDMLTVSTLSPNQIYPNFGVGAKPTSAILPHLTKVQLDYPLKPPFHNQPFPPHIPYPAKPPLPILNPSYVFHPIHPI